MLKKIKLAAVTLLLPLLAFAQSYPSPTYQNVTVLGALTSTGGVGYGNLPVQIPNSLIGNVTNSTAAPNVVGLPSCSSNTNALIYTNGAGFTCNTNINASTLGGQIFAAPGPIGSSVASTGAFTTLSASSTVSGAGFTTLLSPYAPLASPTFTGTPAAPTAAVGTNTTQIATTAFVLANSGGCTSCTITTPNIIGVTNGSNAAAGSVGEYKTIDNTSSPLTLISNAQQTVVSLSLPAGDWDVWGTVSMSMTGGAAVNNGAAGLSLVNNTLASNGLDYWQILPNPSFATNSPLIMPCPHIRVSVSSTTTVYLVAGASFASGTVTAKARIDARRAR